MHPLCFYFIISKLYEPGVYSAFFRQSYLFSSLSVYIQATQLCFTDAKIAISYAKIKHNQNIFPSNPQLSSSASFLRLNVLSSLN